MKSLLAVLPLLVSIPMGTVGFPQSSDALTVSPELAPSPPAPPVDVIEGEQRSSHPCGMASCANMLGCTAAGTAVAAHGTSVLASTLLAPDDLPLILAFRTSTRTAIPPPPRA